MSGTVSSGPAARRIPLSHYFALGGGVCLEWYDWSIYGLLAALFAPQFFPSSDPVVSTLSALAVFALGYFIRPISAAIFGPVADRMGHKKVLIWSIALMAGCSFIMGVLPTYGQIGPWAGVLMTVVRLLQGISTGIEQPAANAAGLELAPPGRRAYFGCVVNGSFNQGGNLLAAFAAFAVSAILGRQGVMDWGWRIPFIIGGLAGFVVLFMRRTMPETGSTAKGAVAPASTGAVWRTLGVHWLGLLAIITMVGGTQIANLAWLSGLPNLANSVYRENPARVFAITTMLGVLLVVAGPISGWLADRYGPSRIYIILRVLLIPAYALLPLYAGPGLGTLFLVTLIGGAVLALNQVLFNYLTGTLMPLECRTTGIAVGYGIGVSVFGGTASYLLIWFERRHQLGLFALYGAAMAAVSVLVYWWAERRGETHADAQ